MKEKRIQWIELDRSALTHNIQQFRNLIGPGRKLLAMVKANAYGHGMIEVSRIALDAGADWLGVHSLDEGICLREAGIENPVLVSGYILESGLEEAVSQDLRITVYDRNSLDKLAEISQSLGKKACVHVKIETGTHRQGLSEKEALPFIKKIHDTPELVLEGISSHFANIEDTTDHSYFQFQLSNFKRMINELEKEEIHVPIKHIACSAAAILFPETYFDMARIGIGIYGLWPSKETYLSCLLQNREPLHLEPVLSWKARIAQLKQVPAGSYIGYGCTYKTGRNALLAVLPVGYYDGYSRGLSNSFYVLAKGQRAPIRGRVAMDFIVADVTDIPGLGVEDIVTLIGKDGNEIITANDIATQLGTINYEVVTRLSPFIPRFVV